jgi:hypothetical protein
MKHTFLKNPFSTSQEAPRLHYLDQSAHAVWANNRYSFGELCELHKYNLRAKCFSVKAGGIEIDCYVNGLIEIHQ